MASAPETVSTLNGLYKEVYADGIKDLIPNGTKVQKYIPFVPKVKQLGNEYHQPVVLSYASGFTHAAASSGAFTLNDAKAGTMKDAKVSGSQILLREQMDYEAAFRAKSSKGAFVDATALLFENMQKSFRKRVECELLYGAQSVATVSSYGSPTITVSTATWAPGIWAGTEGMEIEVYNGSSSRGSDTIASVDIDARTITLTTGVAGTTANDVIYFKGAYGNEMSGVHKILTNTGSLFNISASTYNLWKATSYSASSGALTFAKVRKAVAKAVGRGLDEDCILLVNPGAWDDLMNDLAALRRITEKGNKSYEIGAESITFYSQNGKLEIVPSIYVQEGSAYGLCTDYWKRIGAVDFTFGDPVSGDKVFFHLQDKAGFEVRAYSNQAILCEAPAKNFIITSIVNS